MSSRVSTPVAFATAAALAVTLAGCPAQDADATDGAAARDPADVASDEASGPADGASSRAEIVPEVGPLDVAPEATVDAEPEVDAPAPGSWDDLTPPGPSVPTIRSMLGVSTHMKQSAGDDARRDFEFERYVELGGARIREDYHWHKIEPADDEWHFEVVAGQVAMAGERGVPVLAMLAYAVDWAVVDDVTSTIDPAEYAEYAAATAAHYCGQVDAIEIWNEPNIDRFWKPHPDSEHYGKLLAAAYPAIKEACPGAIVTTGGFASYDFDNPEEMLWMFAEMHAYDANLCDSFDVVAFHPYTIAQKPPPEFDWAIGEGLDFLGQRAQVARIRELLAEMGCPDRPIWFTEAGWPSYEIGEQAQGRYLARGVLLAALDGIEAYYWYTFWDGDPATESIRPHEDYFGLFGWVGPDGSERRPKHAWEAMKGLADVLGEARFARDLSPSLGLPQDVYALAFMDDAGQTTVAAWDGRDVPDKTLDGDLPGGPDTTWELELPLPAGTAGVVQRDITGAEVADDQAAESVQVTLTPEVRYLVLVR